MGYTFNGIHQLQLEYYLEDYFIFGPNWILYNQIIYLLPSYYYHDAKALRLSYGRRFQLGKFYIIPKGGITCGFLGTISQPYVVIEWQGLLHTITLISEITEYSTFHPYLAFGLDLESPRFLKRFSATLNGYYNLAMFPVVKEDISLIIDRQIIYYKSITDHLNHSNMMFGLRYYFSL